MRSYETRSVIKRKLSTIKSFKCPGKVCHASPSKANGAKRTTHGQGKRLHVYYCRVCQAYHLGHRWY